MMAKSKMLAERAVNRTTPQLLPLQGSHPNAHSPFFGSPLVSLLTAQCHEPRRPHRKASLPSMALLRWLPSDGLPPTTSLPSPLGISLYFTLSLPYFLFPLIYSLPSSNTQLKIKKNGSEGLASLDASNSSNAKQLAQSFQTQGKKLAESLLRGRFLRDDRLVDNDRPASMAESELGLLRQRQTVSGLRICCEDNSRQVLFFAGRSFSPQMF
ncbi:hypothetical protein I3843_04G121300 [Carya illinoinensis]|nr:hypothetical protein I3843_04G121300 [Carya illinoinensis]